MENVSVNPGGTSALLCLRALQANSSEYHVLSVLRDLQIFPNLSFCENMEDRKGENNMGNKRWLPRTHGLHNRCFSFSPGVWKYEIKLSSAGVSLLAGKWPPSHSILMWALGVPTTPLLSLLLPKFPLLISTDRVRADSEILTYLFKGFVSKHAHLLSYWELYLQYSNEEGIIQPTITFFKMHSVNPPRIKSQRIH